MFFRRYQHFFEIVEEEWIFAVWLIPSLLPTPHRHAVNDMATRSSTLRGAKAIFAAVLERGASLIWSAASIAAFPYGFKS